MSRLNPQTRQPFQVTNQGAYAEIRIIGEINWWANSSAEFTRLLVELRAAGVTELRGYINSPGGSMFDGNEIYNQIAAFPGRKTCVLGALAASAATTVACAFSDGIEMAANGQYMIHNPCLSVEGSEKELKSALQLYANIRQAAVDIYVKRTGQTPEEVSDMMEATTWMTARQAQEKGFITGITGEAAELPEDAAEVFNLYKFKNVPAAVNQAALASSVTPIIPTNQSTMNRLAITNSLGMPSNAADSEVEAKVASVVLENTTLKNQLEAEKTKVAKERAELLVDNAIAGKKIGAGQRDAYVSMATMNYDAVKATLDAQPAVVAITNQLQPDTEVSNVSNETGAAGKDDRSKWVLNDYMEKDPQALQTMAEKEPAKYEALVNKAYPNKGR
jgi:ATP-dependent Clp protease protease subunit